MAHPLNANIPTRYEFLKLPVTWEMREVEGKPAVLPYFERPQLWVADFVELDPWELRTEFQRLDINDEAKLLEFLNKVGMWGPWGERANRGNQLKGKRQYPEEPTFISDIAKCQKLLLVTMKDRRFLYPDEPAYIIPQGTPFLRWGPVTLRNFGCLFVLEDRQSKPHLVLRTVTFWEAVMASLHVDRLHGARYAKCARPDCQVMFEKIGRYKRKYCSWYCGHLESIRATRKRAKKEQKGGSK